MTPMLKRITESISYGALGVSSSLGAIGITTVHLDLFIKYAGGFGALIISTLTIIKLWRDVRPKPNTPPPPHDEKGK